MITDPSDQPKAKPREDPSPGNFRPSSNEPAKSHWTETAVQWVGGPIGGFIGLLMASGLVLVVSRQGEAIVSAYLIATFITAVWLATKRNWRGFAIGIFLGLGVTLLMLQMSGSP